MPEEKAGPLAQAVDANVPKGLIARVKMQYAMGIYMKSGEDNAEANEIERIAESLREEGIEVAAVDVLRWKNTSAPDGVGWDDLREGWGGKITDGQMVPFPVDGEEDALRRVLGQAEHLMAVASQSLRDVDLFTADKTKVDYLYTAGGVEVPVGGLRPQHFGQVKDGVKTAADIIAAASKRLKELQEGIADRQLIVMQVAKEIFGKLTLSFEQQEQVKEMMVTGQITDKVGGSMKEERHGGEIPELGPEDADVAAEADEEESDFDRALKAADDEWDGDVSGEEDDEEGEDEGEGKVTAACQAAPVQPHSTGDVHDVHSAIPICRFRTWRDSGRPQLSQI